MFFMLSLVVFHREERMQRTLKNCVITETKICPLQNVVTHQFAEVTEKYI